MTRKANKNLAESFEEMQDAADLTHDEKELILKALSYYQVHLFDEKSKKSSESDDAEYKKTTLVIKKIHSSIEKHPQRIS